MQYKGTTKLIPDIAKELGVAHVLEGSVRRSGDQIRIVAQLIKAVSDEHLWAETFDRKYADIFTIQTEVAKKIAVAMQATLTPSEQAYIEENPTENLNAYNFYMQGKLSFEAFAGILTELHQIEKAISFYKQAIDLDPSYLLAYTGLVEAHVMLVNNRSGVSEDNISLAAEYLSRAIELNPTHPSVYKARGLFAYYTEWDYEKALENFNNALKGSPNDSDVLSYMAAVVRRQGKFEESRQLYKQAIAINPRSASLIYNASSTSAYLHEWEEERMYLDLLVALEADDSYWKGSIATNMFNQTGNIDAALKYLYAIDDKDNLVDNFENLYYLLYYKRDLDEIRKLLAINSASDFYPNYRMYGQAELMMGNMEKAHSYFDTLKTEANEQLKRVPNDPTTLGYLALAQVGLGDIKAGILTAEKAVKLKPITDDAMIGARSMWLLLDVYSQAKDKEAALNLLERLLPLPSDISLNDVKFDQVYDFIRDEPRFKALIKKYDKRSA
jgi:tetratricopeptide (TPR) repeat protein